MSSFGSMFCVVTGTQTREQKMYPRKNVQQKSSFASDVHVGAWCTRLLCFDQSERGIVRRESATSFSLRHFQGTNPLVYDTRGWLKACRENPVARNVSGVLCSSNR